MSNTAVPAATSLNMMARLQKCLPPAIRQLRALLTEGSLKRKVLKLRLSSFSSTPSETYPIYIQTEPLPGAFTHAGADTVSEKETGVKRHNMKSQLNSLLPSKACYPPRITGEA